jgi:large subunit ribosomal protein L22
MGQSANPKRTNEFEARAFAKTLRVTPRKLGLVAGLIRNKTAAAALNALSFSKRRIAGDVKKLLLSAIANAENNQRLDLDKLVVSEAHVGKAFVMKRFHARGRGKSAGIHKFFSNMTIVLREAGAPASNDKVKKAEAMPEATAEKAAPKKAAKAEAAKAPAKPRKAPAKKSAATEETV